MQLSNTKAVFTFRNIELLTRQRLSLSRFAIGKTAAAAFTHFTQYIWKPWNGFASLHNFRDANLLLCSHTGTVKLGSKTQRAAQPSQD